MTASRRDFLKLGAAASLSTVFLPRETFARYEAEAESKGSSGLALLYYERRALHRRSLR